jgi:cell shape-determining protein MreC
MKMTFQIKHTKQNFFDRNFFKIILISLPVLIFVLTFSFSGSARSFVSDALSPVFSTGNFFYESFNRIPAFFSSKNSLMEENKNLSDEIENNRIDLIEYESLKYENQKLREALKIKPAGNFAAAAIIARSPQIPLDSLFLDEGTKNGLSDGNLVLAGERILIGKIAEVSKNKSTVALNSFAGMVSYGYVARTNEPVEIKGSGGGSIEAKVPIDFDIVVGDKILVTGSLTYVAAIVGMVEEDKSSGFKNILMSLPVDISKINTVFVEPSVN